MAEIQNFLLLNPRFEEFTVFSLSDFVDGDRDKMLLSPVRALRRYLGRTEQFCHASTDLFTSVT